MDVQGFYPYINELVNDVFIFKKDIIRKAKDIFSNLDSNLHTMVSIHIRLTDLDAHLKRLWNLPNASDEYFEKAMDYLHKKYKVKQLKLQANILLITCQNTFFI